MTSHELIVVGGSAGSFTAVQHILHELPADLPAAVMICTHRPPDGTDYRIDLLGNASSLPVCLPIDGQPLEPGRVYLAPADRHLLAIDHVIRLGRGPRENMARPAIDPLFRSAALSFGSRTIGVVLSGMLNDGASGLHAIGMSGGTTVVQHPLDAAAAAMPSAALAAVAVDHVARAAQLGALLGELVRTPPRRAVAPQPELQLEVGIALGERLGIGRLMELAEPSPFSCPHCHGVLSRVKPPGPLRYRCQIGHGFTAECLLDAQHGEIHEAMVIAMRMMEERLSMVERMAEDARAAGRDTVAELYESRAVEYRRYAETLRQAVSTGMSDAAAVDLEES